MLFYSVYILKLSNGDYYIGRTENIKRRLREHYSGQERTTKRYLPYSIEAIIYFKSKDTAFKFERYLKTGSGIAFRNKHLV
ncbi:excinuclease ABC subunit C [Candidatus Woesebacteria bacterium RBG_16_34_12]|uniref:Excinuclease ABC subunit C n=1 Tax=Candidatus Woesebacteria bacterium RBG_16_34_12 TaxID=1802480 RepID=A0A1F7X6U4_9BACT|nr:MAG: excinuclease ABC subunit C [Candidatus Woesebacteria bacterium RBG_16_34_12]